MGAMTIRNLDAAVLETLRRRASEEDRSLHSLVVQILTRAAEEEERRERMQEAWPRLQKLRRDLAQRFPKQTPSEKLIREDRDR
jgi:plasmid stability protein